MQRGKHPAGKRRRERASQDDDRWVGGAGRCAGTLKHVGEWGPVEGAEWAQKAAAVVCERFVWETERLPLLSAGLSLCVNVAQLLFEKCH